MYIKVNIAIYVIHSRFGVEFGKACVISCYSWVSIPVDWLCALCLPRHHIKIK